MHKRTRPLGLGLTFSVALTSLVFAAACGSSGGSKSPGTGGSGGVAGGTAGVAGGAAGAAGVAGGAAGTDGGAAGSDGGAAGSDGGAAGSDGGADDAVRPVPTVAITKTGDIGGSEVQMMVPSTGATVTSADGRLTIEVPSGALAAAQMITIQPITNLAPGGVGSAYRLGPDGQTFLAPVKLTFTYGSADIAGSEPLALQVAYQDSMGRWASLKSVTRDDTAKTVSVVTSHFSDWTMALDWQLSPPSAMVPRLGTVDLVVNYCDNTEDTEDTDSDLRATCRPDWGFFEAKQWAVNGVTNGNTTVGQVVAVADVDPASATYTAPVTAVANNPVAVSATMYVSTDNRKVVLVSNIWVDGHPPLAGTITSTQQDSANDNVVITTNATVTFAWDDNFGLYISKSGDATAKWDVVTADCETHLSYDHPIGIMDGEIILAGGGYFPQGKTDGDFTGTTTCNPGHSSAPLTVTQTLEWWPAPTGQYSIKPDGSLAETLPAATDGTKTIAMQWSLTPQAPPP